MPPNLPANRFAKYGPAPVAQNRFAKYGPAAVEQASEPGGSSISALTGGGKNTYNALRTAFNVWTGDNEEALEFASQDVSQTPSQEKFMQAIQTNMEQGDDSLMDGIRNVVKAAWQEPRGAFHEMVAQLPNSAAVLGGMYAGAKVGGAIGGIGGSAVPVVGTAIGGGVGVAIGTITGGILGMFTGNVLLESGFLAKDKTDDGTLTSQEMADIRRQGLTKGGVITGIDTATIGLSRAMLGAPGRAVERAVTKALVDEGVDVASETAVRIALSVPDTLTKVLTNGGRALTETMRRGTRTSRGLTAFAAETISEGAGEYLGSLAAGLEASPTDAVMESLLSIPQSLTELRIAKELTRKGNITKLAEEIGGAEIQPIMDAGSVDDAIAEADNILNPPPGGAPPGGTFQNGRPVSPVTSTTTTTINGKRSVKTGHKDGSVRVDGLVVTPATVSPISTILDDPSVVAVQAGQVLQQAGEAGAAEGQVQQAQEVAVGGKVRVFIKPISQVGQDEMEVQEVTITRTKKIPNGQTVYMGTDQNGETVTFDDSAQTIFNPSDEDVVMVKKELADQWKAAAEAEARKVPIAKIDPVKRNEVVLQNRDRTSPDLIAQMKGIAKDPDPSRLSFSRDAANGAPVVFDTPPETIAYGKTDHAVTAIGRKLDMQYAVVEAEDLIASHTVNGSANPAYANDTPALRVIGGNGRIAGLQEAFRLGNTSNYVAGIVGDTGLHGVTPEQIATFKNPVLVRVMRNDDVTPNIGDELNGRTNAELSTVEQAKTDVRRLKLEALEFDDNGQLTTAAVKSFVLAMPENERSGLMDKGQPGQRATDRVMAALFYQAYGNEELVRIYAQSTDEESKAIINALAASAPAMARLQGTDLDIRSIVVDAAKAVVSAKRRGMSLAALAQQADIEVNPISQWLIGYFANNIRSPKRIAETLNSIAKRAYDDSNKPAEDMFGAAPKLTADELFKEYGYEQGTAQGNANQGRTEPVPVVGRTEADVGAGQDQAQASQEPAFDLAGQNEAEIAADEDAIAAAAKVESDKVAAADKAKSDKEQADRVKANVDNMPLVLGQSKEDVKRSAKSGMDDIFSQAETVMAKAVSGEQEYQKRKAEAQDIAKPKAEAQPKSELAQNTEAMLAVAAALKAQTDGKNAKEQKANDSILTKTSSIIDRMYKGGLKIEEFKAAFNYLIENKEALRAELASKTKPQLLDEMGTYKAYQYKNDKKDRVISAVISELTTDFLVPTAGDSGMVSYTVGMSGDSGSAIAVRVEAITQEMLDAVAVKQARREEENKDKLAAREEGIENPETIEDYKNLMNRLAKEAGVRTFTEGRALLSLEQRIEFDKLAASETRDKRVANKDDQKTRLQTSSQLVEGEIIETKHTKKGHDLFVVQLGERVSKEDYNALNASAKRLGGYYSSFRGAGAIPGFTFTERENAEAFKKLAGGDTAQAQEVAEARRDSFKDDKSQSAVERLREMADAMEERANESLNQDRKVNTSRRASMAAGADAKANSSLAMAATMRKIADGIESGDVKFLDQVRTKIQVEMLESFIYVAKHNQAIKENLPQNKREEVMRSPATPETVDHAGFPVYKAWRSDLAKLGRQLQEISGTKRIGDRLIKLADDVSSQYTKFAKDNLHKVSTFTKKDGGIAAFPTKKQAAEAILRSGYNGEAIPLQIKKGEHAIVMSPSAAQRRGIWQGQEDTQVTLSPDFAREFIGKLSRKSVDIPWQLDSANDKRKRLQSMNIETPAEFRAMLVEFVSLQETPKPIDKVKELERSMVGRANDGLDFFPTPAAIADEMIETAGIEDGMTVLEPSAGMGHIADQLRQHDIEPDVVEMSSSRRELLEAKGYNLVGRDFMDTTEKYDRIIMNPPFSDRRDFAHVQHAYSLLNPGDRKSVV